MSVGKCFLDTNLWVYLYSDDAKAIVVEHLIDSQFEDICLSTQVVSELYSVLTRKHLQTLVEAQKIINDMINSFSIYGIDAQCIQSAIAINIRYQFAYWDSLIIASALEADCAVLYSEDMQHGQLFDHQLRIVNPFLENTL